MPTIQMTKKGRREVMPPAPPTPSPAVVSPVAAVPLAAATEEQLRQARIVANHILYSLFDPMTDPSQVPTDPEIDALLNFRLHGDLKKYAQGISPDQAQIFVSMYMEFQENRIRRNAQVKAFKKSKRDADLIDWFAKRDKALEEQVHLVLTAFSRHDPMCRWLRSIRGFGPVLAAKFACGQDWSVPTVGHVYSFCGQLAHQRWVGRKGADKIIDEHWPTSLKLKECDAEMAAVLTKAAGRSVHSFMPRLLGTSRLMCSKLLASRPWSAVMKTNCWLYGWQLTMAQGTNDPKDFYSPILASRKLTEIQKNIAGEFASEAERSLREKDYGASTVAYMWLSGQVTREEAIKYYAALEERRREVLAAKMAKAAERRKERLRKLAERDADLSAEDVADLQVSPNENDIDGDDEPETQEAQETSVDKPKGKKGKKEDDFLSDTIKRCPAGHGVPMLPPAHIHARAQRVAVKRAVADMHVIGHYLATGQLPATPYQFTALAGAKRHAHMRRPPNMHLVPGLEAAWNSKYGSGEFAVIPD